MELPVSNLDNQKKDWKSQFAGWNTKEGVSLVLVKFALKKFVAKKFDGTDLDAMTAVFDTLRSLGMKAIVRYSYVQCEKADGSFIFQEDAKKEQLLNHIKQVTPILKVTNQSINWLYLIIVMNKLDHSLPLTEKSRCHLRPTSRFHRLLGRMVLHHQLRRQKRQLQAECVTEKGSRRNYEGPTKCRSQPDGSDADARLETGIQHHFHRKKFQSILIFFFSF